MANEKNNDLPLMSNVNEILVQHYIFNFICDFEEKCFNCCAVLFLEPVMNNKMYNCDCFTCTKSQLFYNQHFAQNDGASFTTDANSQNVKNVVAARCSLPFVLILDCHKILVNDVEEINLMPNDYDTVKYSCDKPSLLTACCKLSFITDEWSLKIWKTECSCKIFFPKVIRISYKTMQDGPSLLWVNDQDKNPAVFTYGACINNRSLFPCQEPPSAMATWEATVSVTKSAVVLMSGDEAPRLSSGEGVIHYYYCTRKILPLSTLCLAIGFWDEHVISSKYRNGPKCRIFAPSSLLNRSVHELFEYVPYCLKISEDILGSYPFPRIDFLVVPPTFGSLGMASPNIIFLSQSVLTGDGSMCSRVAHEIAHGWFGLLIGASDWTEEWLSEGFATFMEDYFHVWTTNMQEIERKEYIEVKTYIRLRTLLHEVNNTSEEFQVLRPSQGKTHVEKVDGVDAAVLKNAQNPLKAFVQVHYIKGYFLLKYLSDIVGLEIFLHFLRAYVNKFQGQLITSKDFLVMFFQCFPDVEKILTMNNIYENWLHNPGIADELKNLKPTCTNKLYIQISKETEKWLKLNSFLLKKHLKKRKPDLKYLPDLTSEQMILLLENLLDEETLTLQTLKYLQDVFSFESLNAEVLHRWFELVAKYKYKSAYSGLKSFLTDHLAMGVYLYGELIFSDDPLQRRIAKECYTALKSEMEPSYQSTIDQMFLDCDTK